MAPHFVLAALNVDYQLHLVDRKNQAQKSAEYLALNPAGRIPTLIVGEQIIFESPAICIYLAETHPERELIPKVGDPKRAQFFQWMMYLTNTLQAELMIYFYPEKHTQNQEVLKDIVNTQEHRLADIFQLLDNQLNTNPYLIGDKLTVCDHFLFMLAVWGDEIAMPPLSFPNLSKYLRRMALLPEIIDVCKKEGLSLKDYQ